MTINDIKRHLFTVRHLADGALAAITTQEEEIERLQGELAQAQKQGSTLASKLTEAEAKLERFHENRATDPGPMPADPDEETSHD